MSLPFQSHNPPDKPDMLKLVMETCGYSCAYYGGLLALKCSQPFLFVFKPLYFATTAPLHVLFRILHAVSKNLGPASIHPALHTAKRCTRSLPSSGTRTDGPLRVGEDNAFRCLGYFFETVFGIPLFDVDGSKLFVPDITETRDQPCLTLIRYQSNVLLHLFRFLDFLTVANACRILRACDLSDDAALKPIRMYQRVSLQFSNPLYCSCHRKSSCKEIAPYRGGRHEYLLRWMATCAKRARPIHSATKLRSTIMVYDEKVSNNMEPDDSETGKLIWEEGSFNPQVDTVLIFSQNLVPPTAETLETSSYAGEFPVTSPSTDAPILDSETTAGQPVETKGLFLDGSGPTNAHPSILIGMSSLNSITELTKDDTVICMERREVRVTRVSPTELIPANLQKIIEENVVEGENVAERQSDGDSAIHTCEADHENHKDRKDEKRHGVACRLKHGLRKLKGKFVDVEG